MKNHATIAITRRIVKKEKDKKEGKVGVDSIGGNINHRAVRSDPAKRVTL